MRYRLNKLFGFQQWEPGMEEQYREVLCREMVTMQTDMHIPGELVDPECTLPPLLLEMSHFYLRGCHNTPLPVIIIRTPYDRALMRHTTERICQHGYHVIIQDTRNSPNAAAMRRSIWRRWLQSRTRSWSIKEAKAIRRKYQAKSPKLTHRAAADAAAAIQPFPPEKDRMSRCVVRIGPPPADNAHRDLNMPPVLPANFPHWADTMNGWGEKILGQFARDHHRTHPFSPLFFSSSPPPPCSHPLLRILAMI
jgi:hypothetical protein